MGSHRHRAEVLLSTINASALGKISISPWDFVPAQANPNKQRFRLSSAIASAKFETKQNSLRISEE